MVRLGVLAVLLSGCACESGVGITGETDVGSYDGWVDVAGDSSNDVSGTPPPDVPDVPWDLEPPEGGCPFGWTCRTSELPVFRGVDILVVVDNSKSMAEEQANLAEEFPSLISNLLDPPLSPSTGHPSHVPITDLHIGVVSTDMGTGGYTVETCSDPIDGDGGVFLHDPNPLVAGCESSYTNYLQYDTETVDPEGVAAMSTAFGCIATLGTTGCGFEQPLEAGKRAIENALSGGLNSGFLRDDSVLMIIFLTDEEDGSVADPHIFDTADSTLGHLNLRAFLHPYMLQDVEVYIEGFKELRDDSIWPLLLGMIVGVPPEEKECNGFGDMIPNCLIVPEMQEWIDPSDPTRLMYSCNTANGYAFPPRRLVEVAQAFGHDAYVHSICQGDFEPILTGLSQLANNFADGSCDGIVIELTKRFTDPCVCETKCRVVQVMADHGGCPAGTTEWDHDGDGVPNEVTDAGGDRVSACEVPYADTGLGDCSLECQHTHQTHHPVGEGWYYSLDYVGVACPTVKFTAGYELPDGASSFVACPM